ncbi:hypothetical protein HDU93_003681 [Gonapodya sp. JEL0774]|nr:hypothetical protein HDU93_003681 [Gonapodya sp. JEL0774]
MLTANLSDNDHSRLTATQTLSSDLIGAEDESVAVAKFSKSFKVIPIMDLAMLRGTPEQKKQFLDQFRDVMLTCGFLYIKNTGISDDLQKRIYDVVVKTFALPREEKVKFAIEKSPCFKGWNELGKEVTYGKNDMRELIGIGYDNRLRLPDEPLWYNTLGSWNIPTEEQVPGFRATVTEYLTEVHKLAVELLHAAAETLELPVDYFDKIWLNDTTGREASHFQFNHYPSIDVGANPEWADNLGDAAHQDDDIVTILAQDMVGGLQVQNFDGDWIDVKPIEGTQLGFCDEAYFLQPKITTARWVEPLPDEVLPEYVRNNKPEVKNRYEAMEFNRKIAKTIGEYMYVEFYVKQMKSYPEAKEIHYPDVDWVKELNIDPVLAKKFL